MAHGQKKIESMYAFIVLDPEDNTEGIPALSTPNGPMPLIGADLERIDSLRPIVKELAQDNDWLVTLAHFTIRTDVETFDHRKEGS